MSRILVFVAPHAVRVRSDAGDSGDAAYAGEAASLLEAVTASMVEPRLFPATGVAVVADVLDCIEIGTAVLGRRWTETVEGPAPPPVVALFPFLPRDDVPGEWLVAALACLRDLADDGAGAAVVGAGDEVRLPDPALALVRALDRGWDVVVAFGAAGETDAVLLEWHARTPDARIVRPHGFEEAAERVEALLSRIAPRDDERFRDVRRRAVTEAVRLESLLRDVGYDDDGG